MSALVPPVGNSIRRVLVASSNVTTFALSSTRADPASKFSAPAALAVNNVGSAAWIADAGNNRLLVAHFDRTASTVCAAGEHCPAGSSSRSATPCPPGYFCATGSDSAACPAGVYCSRGSPSAAGNLLGAFSSSADAEEIVPRLTNVTT